MTKPPRVSDESIRKAATALLKVKKYPGVRNVQTILRGGSTDRICRVLREMGVREKWSSILNEHHVEESISPSQGGSHRAEYPFVRMQEQVDLERKLEEALLRIDRLARLIENREVAARSESEQAVSGPAPPFLRKITEEHFKGKTIGEAALVVLRRGPATPTQIAKELIDGGYPIARKDPSTSVSQALSRRLEKVGDVKRIGGGYWQLISPDEINLISSDESVPGPKWPVNRDLHSRKTREALAAAKEVGCQVGRPSKLTEEQAHELIQMRKDGKKISSIMAHYGLSKTAVYNYINTHNKKT